MAGALLWPLVLGLALAAVFYALVLRGPLNHPLILRYFVGHPVCVVETFFFFICLGALYYKFSAVCTEYSALAKVTLGQQDGIQPLSKANDLLAMLADLPPRLRNSYLARRLFDSLELVARRGSADGLEAELKHLSDMDAARQQDSYALIRIIVWATPML